MSEYRDIKILYQLIQEQINDLKVTGAFSKGMLKAFNIVKSMLHNKEQLPTADVQEVRHGKWKLNSYYCDENICFDITVSCSKCGKEYCRETVADVQDSDEMFNYCPNCGAKMDGKD